MAQLQLSSQLISEVCQVLEKSDPQAQDPGIASQYLSAIVGFLLGQQDMSLEQKKDIVDELAAFTMHVVNDVQKQSNAQPAQPDPAEAFGVWKPGMS